MAQTPEERRIYVRKWRAEHREEINVRKRAWYHGHQEHVRALNYRQRYGVSIDEAEQLVIERQTGVCAICGERRGKLGLCIDHDHTTKQVRGWLCGKCNRGLGCFDDNSGWLRKAAEFIDNNKE
jgi:hypothetical protein